MCYRTKLNATHSQIEKEFNAKFTDPGSYVPMEEVNAFSFPETPVITDYSPGEIQFFNWGLIPGWAKDQAIRKKTLNARIETAEEKPSFRNAVSNRCLIIANGFYEWQWQDAKGKVRKKYLIYPEDQEIFAFAGIYSTWSSPEENNTISSYSILTTNANELMEEIHNTKKRMPVVLKERDRSNWLSGAEMSNFAFPYEVPLKASVE